MNQPMDLILYNGRIVTMEAPGKETEAVAIKAGEIFFTGPSNEALALESRKAIDLQGKLVLPGFQDSHLHFIHYAFLENSIKLFDCCSVEEILTLAEKAYEGENAGWIYCRGWNEGNFAEKRYPTRSDLDTVCPDLPAMAVRVCGHISVCNSCALEKIKQLSDYQALKEDIDLETGLLKESAVTLFYQIMDSPSQEYIKNLIRFSCSKMNEAGITGVQSDDLMAIPGAGWQNILQAYQSLSTEGGMSVRVFEQCLFTTSASYRNFLAQGHRPGQGNDFFEIGPLKLLMDGSLGARTAALNEPYEGTGETGMILFSQEELDELVALAQNHGMSVAVHCIGDRAMDMTIAAVRKAQTGAAGSVAGSPRRPDNLNSSNRADSMDSPTCQTGPDGPENQGRLLQPCRHGIVHAQITNERILNEMAEQNMVAFIQPVFTASDMDVAEDRIGSRRLDKTYAWKTMGEQGIIASGGSDAPVEPFSILENIYYTVTRQKKDGTPCGGWLPEEKLSVYEAVELFTTKAAYTGFCENRRGTVTVGKDADLVILDEDIFAIEETRIKDVQVLHTIVAGNVVYSRDGNTL